MIIIKNIKKINYFHYKGGFFLKLSPLIVPKIYSKNYSSSPGMCVSGLMSNYPKCPLYEAYWDKIFKFSVYSMIINLCVQDISV